MYDELVKDLRENHDKYFARDMKAADAIELLQKTQQPKWIPVTERCPEKSGDFLVVDDCGNLYVNEWHCLLKKWQYDDSRITHWMPLPKPPKNAEEGE